MKFGCGGISTSKTKHKKYYLCTSDENMEALKDLNNPKQKIIRKGGNAIGEEKER